MTAEICPGCGKVLTGDRPKFCENCGYDLNQRAEADSVSIEDSIQPEIEIANPQKAGFSLTPEQKESIFLEKMKVAIKDGDIPPDEASKLSALRERLGITADRAKELFEKVIQSFSPVQPGDLQDKPKGTSHGLVLSINTNHFYMEGFCGIIELQIQNLSDDVFDEVKTEISGNLLKNTYLWCCSRLDPCASGHECIPVEPSKAGEKLIRFSIALRKKDKWHAFWSDFILPVFENTKEFHNVLIQAEKLIDFGSVSDNAKYMGNSVRNNIENLIKFDRVRTANDLMKGYSNLNPDYKELKLVSDPGRSKQLTDSLAAAASYNSSAKRVIHPGRGSQTDTASLFIEAKDKLLNVVLIAKPSVTIGRARKNDIVARLLPSGEENNKQSCKITGDAHCYIDLNERGLLVKDNDSDNGTLLDEKTVDSKGRKITGSGQKLKLAGVLNLSIKCVNRLRDWLKDAPYKEIISELSGELWKTASKAELNSVTLERLNNLGSDDKQGCESYCLIYRIATIGSKPDCSLSFTDRGLEPVHAAILYLDEGFYLENLTELTNVFVNDFTLSKNELIPLGFGDRIRIDRMELRFQKKSQLFIDA
ncbi:MAG: FHA domain-containing protein [Phycisphaerae bacterium]